MFKKEKIKDLHYSVTGELNATELQQAADEVLTEYGKKVKMAGFRPGHIPLKVLRQKYNASAWGEAIDKLMNRDINAYAAEKQIRLAGAPKADLSGWQIGQDVEYSLEFDILPSLPEIDLDKFSITKYTAQVTDKEVNAAIDNLRRAHSTAEKQDAKYAAQNGDTVVIDFDGFLDDKPFEGGAAKKHHLILGSGAFIPGFEDQIIGHKSGDEFDVNVKFPKEYHAKDLSGKDARFAVKLHEVRKHKLPELNDEFAKKVGRKSAQDLRDYVNNILTDQYTEATNQIMRTELLDILADKVKIDLPEILVAQELEMAKQQHDQEHANCTSDHDAGHKWDEKAQRKDAERRVKLGLILAEWGTSNKIDVDFNDMQNVIMREAANHSNPQEVFNYYRKNAAAFNMLRGMVFERKALDAMLTHVKQKEKEVSPTELLQRSMTE